MERNNSNVFIYVILLCVAFGFAYLYQQTKSLELQINNIELSKQYKNEATTTPDIKVSDNNQSKEDVEDTSTNIPSAIIFETKSSPTLSPQAPIVVTIESITPKTDILDINIKAFTSKASSYTALEMPSLVTILQGDGAIIKSKSTSTMWKSMPPKSFVTGTLSFPKQKDQKTIMVRIDNGTGITFYSFDLEKRTYKEVTQ